MAIEDCLIIGSGCAGLTAAIYAARSNIHPLVIGGLVPGGQLMLTTDVENFPGFEAAVLGPELIEKMRRQAERLGARFMNAEVERVNFKNTPLKAWLSDNKELQVRVAIVATGANAKWLGLPSEKRLIGKGISACAVCDGPFFKGKTLGVIGGGDTAMEEALFLTNFSSSVTVIHRRDKLRAQGALEERAKRHPKIKFIWDSVVEEVLGQDHVEGVRLKNLRNEKATQFACEGLFIAIGHTPATQVFAGELDLDEKGYIKTLPGSWVKTACPGVFAAGDCVDHRFRQAVTAAGFGCMAALEARWYLESQ